MEKKHVLEALKKLRSTEHKKKFSQTFDFIVNLKNLNLKKPEERVDLFVQLPNGKGKKVNVCIFVDEALVIEAKKVMDEVVEKSSFPALAKDKKAVKKLASKCDYFVSQANLMPDVAKTFGKILGQRGKMPNPKGGCVVPPKIALKPLLERLQKTVRLQTKNDLAIRCPVGTEEMTDEQLLQNIMAVYDNLMRVLPQGDNNLRSIYLKLTMSPSITVGDTNE